MNKYLSNIFSAFLQSFWQNYILWILIIITAYTVGYAALIYETTGSFFYTDTDCYTRALRIVDWMQDFEWSEKIFPYTNYPDGFVLHFTRICDIIWLFFALPFMLFVPLKEAIFYGGFFFSPFFMALTLITILWGIKPYMESLKDKKLFFFVIFIFSTLFCCKLSSIFDFYRPDHHCLMCFVFAFVVATTLHSYDKKQNYKELFIAGILTACGLWASSAPEGLYIAGIALLILTTDVIFSKYSTKNPLYYATGFFCGNLTAWLINPPLGGYTALNNARLSLIHVVLSALIFISFLIFHLIKLNNKSKKIFALGGMAIISAFLMLILFGSETLFAPIYHETILKFFIPMISEMAPLAYFLMPPVAVGMIIASYLSINKPYERCLSLLYFITAFSGMFVARFYPYYIVVWLVLYAYGMIALLRLKYTDIKYKTALLIYLIWPVFYLALFTSEPDKTPDIKLSGVVLAETFDGPELVWRYNVDTVASPYHTNIAGIRDNHILWFTTNENELKELLKHRHVTYITMYGVQKSDAYPNPQDNTDKLYGKVLTGKDIYPWMEKTEERTYRVNYDKF